ncbi:uncharacterized protein LOC125573188 [Nematostella vectensis]|uniref:uncharacterized protein LOC125573188 n=1 Tax=Nematostella vectensis TaxID=45351 RepID=UPI0020772037|nr:uncharacterized protein LOC125573188 [Nematostella vectensis]
MDAVLKPHRLDLDPNSPTAAKEWKHWLKTFENFIAECGSRAPDRYRTLINYVSHNVYEYIEDCSTYDSAIQVLKQLFIKTPNEIFARHLLATRRQKTGETLTEFLQELRRLCKDCNVKAVSAEQYREELIRDSFINGLNSPFIRQRLLENRELDLKTAFDQANALDLAQKNSDSYSVPLQTASVSAVPEQIEAQNPDHEVPVTAAAYRPSKRCYFCGGPLHNRKDCPAKNCSCNNCGKGGHYAKVCKSKGAAKGTAASICSISAACPESLAQASVEASIAGHSLTALVDTGSSGSYINEGVVQRHGLQVNKSTVQSVSMALSFITTQVTGHCLVDLTVKEHTYPSVRLGVLKNLCSDVILGLDFQRSHNSVITQFGGTQPDLKITHEAPACALSAAEMEEPSLFANLLPDCKPVASKSRQFGKEDQEFVEQEVNSLLSEGIIEPSTSPWRAQLSS